MKNILDKNKKAMGGLGIAMIVFGVMLLAGSILWVGGAFEQSTTTDKVVTDIGACAESTGKLTVNAVSTLAKGTAISTPTITAGVDGGTIATSVTSGTTAFPVGSTVTVLVSKADYIDESFSFVMPCGGYTLQAELYYSTSDNPSIRAKNDEGDYMADSSNAVVHSGINQTAVSSGEVIKWDIELSGTSLESSGNGILVVEFPAGSGANITKVELSGATKREGVPSVHAGVNAGSEFVAFNVPAVVGSDKNVHVLTIELASTKVLQGNVLMDWYAEQKFIETTGQIASGIQNSEGTLTYENTGDFDVRVEVTAGE